MGIAIQLSYINIFIFELRLGPSAQEDIKLDGGKIGTIIVTILNGPLT